MRLPHIEAEGAQGARGRKLPRAIGCSNLHEDRVDLASATATISDGFSGTTIRADVYFAFMTQVHHSSGIPAAVAPASLWNCLKKAMDATGIAVGNRIIEQLLPDPS